MSRGLGNQGLEALSERALGEIAARDRHRQLVPVVLRAQHVRTVGIEENERGMQADAFIAIAERMIGDEVEEVGRSLFHQRRVQQVPECRHGRLCHRGFQRTRIQEPWLTAHILDQKPVQMQDLFDGQEARPERAQVIIRNPHTPYGGHGAANRR